MIRVKCAGILQVSKIFVHPFDFLTVSPNNHIHFHLLSENFQIDGWYNDAKLTLDPAGVIGDASLTWTGDIVGVGEYNLRTDQPVTIKVSCCTLSCKYDCTTYLDYTRHFHQHDILSLSSILLLD